MSNISQTTDLLSNFCQNAKKFLVGVEDQLGHHSRLNPPAVRKKLHQFIMDWRVPRTDSLSIAQISFKTVNTDSFLTGFSPNRPPASQASSKDEDPTLSSDETSAHNQSKCCATFPNSRFARDEGSLFPQRRTLLITKTMPVFPPVFRHLLSGSKSQKRLGASWLFHFKQDSQKEL